MINNGHSVPRPQLCLSDPMVVGKRGVSKLDQITLLLQVRFQRVHTAPTSFYYQQMREISVMFVSQILVSMLI